MKKIKFVLFSVLALGLTAVSCGDDDSSSTSASLEGKWVYAKEGVAAQGQEVLQDYQHTAGCEKDYMLISSTTVKDVWFNNDGEGCEEDSETSNYTRSGNTISIVEGGVTNTATIEKVTATELKISETETLNGTTVKYVTTFTKG
jgi:hypothetical protein